MGTGSENMKKYGEEMIGKFSHKPHGDGIVISVTKPFVEEIHIDCCNEIYQEYREPYSLLEPQEDHPSLRGSNKRAYYNTQDKCYYRSDWKIEPKQTEHGGEFILGRTPIWVRTDTEYLKVHTIRYERLQAHIRRYKEIHKGQLCFFSCYAIDPNGRCQLPKTVTSMFDDHKWYYDPFSFEVKPLDANTIDDFVKETPISKEMTDKMVLYHRKQAEIKQQKEEEEKTKVRKANRETFWKNINAHIEKYDKIYKYIVPGGFLWLLGTIIFGLIR